MIAVGLIAICAIAAVAFAVGSRLSERGGTPDTAPSAGPDAQDGGPIVLAISLDGLNPDAIKTLGATGSPNLHRLMAEGSSTLNARTSIESTKTLPNHTGMITGRRVSGDEGHGVTFNSDTGGTLEETHGSYVPGMFDIAHDRGRQTAFFAEKDKFHYLMRSWDDEHGAEDMTGVDDGRDKTDVDDVAPAGELITDVQAALTAGSTDLVFLHLTAPDRAGHDEGWLEPEYLAAVRDVDAHLGDILGTVEEHPGLRERLTILVTADHGGPKGETTHYDADDVANYRIPFIAWGRGFPAHTDLYASNPQRKDPGPGRPGYSGPQPIRNLDIADTSLRLLGLPPVPDAVASSWPPLNLRPGVG
jgi:hypothetical protein